MAAAGMKAVKSFRSSEFTLEVDADGKHLWKADGGELADAVLLKAEDFSPLTKVVIVAPLTRTYPEGGNGEQ